jgi:hypothetical protein
MNQQELNRLIVKERIRWFILGMLTTVVLLVVTLSAFQ